MSSLKLACCLLALSGAAAVATTDPLSQLSVNAGRGPPKVSCTFANGSRTKSLPDEFFGFEPCVFASGMVLRANDTALGGAGAGAGAAVWGWAKPAEMVSVTIGSVAAGSATADAKGRWQLALQMTASAAPHTVAVHGSVAREAETQVVSVLENVLFGSVFLCSGQSNMDFAVCALDGRGGAFVGCNHTVPAAASGRYDDIRMMHGGATGHWFNSSDNSGKSVGGFSAVCYLTALQIKKNIPGYAKRPIGLVQASVGGTVIEEWMSTEALEQCLPPNESVLHAGCAAGQQHNSDLYYGHVDPLAPMSLSAAYWYQGESNVPQNFNAKNTSSPFRDYYACLFAAKVRSWRKVFANPTLFYGFVSLAAYGHGDGDSATRSADGLPRMRMDQNSILKLPLTYAALAYDLGDDGKVPYTPPSSRHGGIHPRNKTEVARRMALGFAKGALGHNVVSLGPMLTSTKVYMEASGSGAGSTVTVAFSGGPVALSPTEQCSTHASGADHQPIPSAALCCAPGGKPRARTKAGMPSDGGAPFELLLSNGSYVLAASSAIGADGKSVFLTAPAEAGDEAVVGVRYGWQSYPYCVLRNSAGLPAMPFACIPSGASGSNHSNPLACLAKSMSAQPASVADLLVAENDLKPWPSGHGEDPPPL